MTTHDIDIELPPLPRSWDCWIVQQMEKYALTAIEADRKRRGEPVAYMFADEWGRTKIVLGKETAEHWCPPDENITPLYTAPQPAEPDEWKLAVDHELTNMQSTADSYPSAKEAVKALINWHVAVATDPVFQQTTAPKHGEGE